MEIPVVIEKVANNGYRVSSTAPFPFAVEAPTKEEALTKVLELVEKREAEGLEVTSVKIDRPGSRRKSWAGYLKDDPLFDAWKEAVEAYRDKVDAEDDRP